jgi:hypothetical protein
MATRDRDSCVRHALVIVAILTVSCGRDVGSRSRSGAVATTTKQQARSTSADSGMAPNSAACRSGPGILCFRDTAYVRADSGNPYFDESASTQWLWFGSTGDSIELSAPSDAHIVTSLGQDRDSLRNTASHFRRRLTHDGLLELAVVMEEVSGDSVSYLLEVRRLTSGARARLRPSGQYATLTIESKRLTDAFSLIPLSMAPFTQDRGHWKASARTHKVALVGDSLYEVCFLPCTFPDTIKLPPFARVVVSLKR